MADSLLLGADLEAGVLSMVLGNGLGAIEDGRGALTGFSDAHGFSAAVVNRMEVIFEEVVANIVRHGFTPGSAQQIHVSARIDTDFVVLVFADDGLAFDPLAQAAPAPFTCLADARPGGLGIPLVRRLASDLAYEAMGEGDETAFRPVNRLTVRVLTQP